MHQPLVWLVPLHAHGLTPRAVAVKESCFTLIGRGHQHGIAVGFKNGENLFHRPFTAETSAIIKHSLGASSTQHMWELLAGNHRAVLPRHARGRRIGCYPDL